MLTDRDLDIPGGRAGAAGSSRAPSWMDRGMGEGPRHRLGTVTAGLACALIGFNAWWAWRDTRPLADPREVEGWIAGGESMRAEDPLGERLRRAPHDVDTRMMLARARAARGDWLGCARELGRVPYWSPRHHEAMFRSAQALLLADRARDAEAALRAILDADPLHPPEPGLFQDAAQELLTIYATEDRWEDAYPVIWKAFDRAGPSDRPRLLALRIRCELERVAPSERIPALRCYVDADPDDLEALRALANAEMMVGQRAEALRHIAACLRAGPDDPRAWRDALTMLRSLGEPDAFRDAIGRLPPSAEAEPAIWVFRGELRERDGDLEGAAADYRRALECHPHRLDAHYHLAMIEYRLGHREPADAHRKRWEDLREARAELRRVDAEFRAALAAADGTGPGSCAVGGVPDAARRLGSVCQALGWSRAAEACREIGAAFGSSH